MFARSFQHSNIKSATSTRMAHRDKPPSSGVAGLCHIPASCLRRDGHDEMRAANGREGNRNVILGDVVERNGLLYPSKEAVVDEKCRLTFAQLADRTTRLANVLVERGTRHGDRVARTAAISTSGTLTQERVTSASRPSL